MTRRPRITLFCALAVTLTTQSARAWYLPEHAEITRKALEYDVPAPLRVEIMKAVNGTWSTVAHRRLPLCSTDVALADLSSDDAVGGAPSVTCIPYNALPAIAADHSLDIDDLVRFMTHEQSRPIVPNHTVASMVVGTSRVEWLRFLDDAPPQLVSHLKTRAALVGATEPADPGSFERRKFTRDLDMRLQLVDHEYLSRAANSKAHFQDAAKSLEALLANAVGGDLDNAVAQAMAHHVRSIALATRARGDHTQAGDALRTAALLEHAFAVHFVQDAFAAGHMGTEHDLDDSRSRLERHDFLNRNGIGATRALAAGKCGVDGKAANASFGLPICWRAQGDGYLDLDNLRYVEEATARAQVELAFALADDPAAILEAMRASPACASWQAGVRKSGGASCTDTYVGPAASMAPPPECDLWHVAQLLDPTPSWTLPSDRVASHRMSAASADDLVACTLHALDTVRASPNYAPTAELPNAGPNDATEPGALTAQALGAPLDPCALCADGACAATIAANDPLNAACSTAHVAMHARLGDPDVSLWRPLLTGWPTTQADVTTLEGQRDQFGQGFATQIAWGMAMHAGLANAVPAAMAVEFGGGISYRLDGILAGRINRPAAELNIAVSPMALSSLDTRASFVGFSEFRAPIPTLLTIVVGYAFRSSGLVDGLDFPGGLGPYGVRVYAIVSPSDRPAYAGWDLEVGYLSLTRAFKVRTLTIANPTETELRVRIGKLDLNGIGKNAPHDVPWSLSLELSGGWAWFL